ncbi:MAG: CCA tRNA nucleotidyltransferase [Candidatus Brocadiaceae bacterium]|jgi:poly(A) polymerase
MIQKPHDTVYEGAERIVERLRGAGHRALLAGGCVRDLLMGKEPKDYDIATDADPDQVERLFSRTVDVGRQFGVCRVMLGGRSYEVATFRRESRYSDGRHPDEVAFCGPEEDARRRDFTINAIFWDPTSGRLLDFVGGRQDLERDLVRAVGRPHERFREDHLRLLRAVRFAARLRFTLEEGTRRAARELAPLVTQVSAERLQEELRIILTDQAPGRALRLMDELEMLCELFPELEDTKGCEQPENYHPEGDVFVHTILTVEKLGPHPDFVLALAALLHDIGKPPASREAGPKLFPEHCRIGAEMAEEVCRRLRLSNRETERVCWLVKRHLYFKDARNMRESTLKKLFAEPGFEQLAELHRADALASWGNLENYEYVMQKKRTMPPEETEPPRLLTGDDLIAMGYEPGPLFGEVLERVRDAQLEGDVSSPEEARELAREMAEELAGGS